MAPPAERIAAYNTAGPQDDALKNPVVFNGMGRVGGTGGRETAVLSQQGRKEPLVAPDNAQQKFLNHQKRVRWVVKIFFISG